MKENDELLDDAFRQATIGNVQKLNLILNSGVDINIQNKYGDSLLHCAVKTKSEKLNLCNFLIISFNSPFFIL